MNENKILHGPIFSNLLRFSIPILFSLLIQALYGAVDLWMVSQFGTTSDITGVSNGSQTVIILHGLVMGLSVGISILLGKSVGEGNNKKSADVIGNGVVVITIIGLILTVLTSTCAPLLTSLLNIPDEAINQTTVYIFITGLGTLCVAGYNILYNIFCGLGDSKTPLLLVFIACLINIILDYILIDLFTLGAMGAAIATIFAQASSVILCLLFVKKKIPFKIAKENFKWNKEIAFKILTLGLPIAFLRALSELSFLVILGFVNPLGLEVTSGVGIAEKLVMFLFLMPNAYMTTISMFVAQNMGAKNMERAQKSFRMGLVISMSFGVILSYLTFFHGDLLCRLFVDDPVIINNGATFLKATSIECLIWSSAMCFDGYFNGREHTTFVMVEGSIVAVLVRIPVAYITTHLIEPHLFKIGLSNTFAALVSLIMAISFYIYIRHKDKKELKKGAVKKLKSF